MEVPLCGKALLDPSIKSTSFDARSENKLSIRRLSKASVSSIFRLKHQLQAFNEKFSFFRGVAFLLVNNFLISREKAFLSDGTIWTADRAE